MTEKTTQQNETPNIKLTSVKFSLPKLKTVNFFNVEFGVQPKWKWVAVDKDGTIVGFTNKPSADIKNEQWDFTRGDCFDIGKCVIKGDWTKTLQKI